ncbi:MAG TPA: hypothetical protein VF624_04145 [Tepidisphaeraceae bacterium]|jgi:hypothetical protein
MGTSKTVASIVHEAASREQAERDHAAKRYVELLTANAGTKADVDELLAHARLLGKTAGDINADRGVIEQAMAQANEVKALAGAETIETAVVGALEQPWKWTAAQIDRLKLQIHTAQAVSAQASGLPTRFNSQSERLIAMKAASPSLLALVDVPPLSLLTDPTVKPETLLPEFVEFVRTHVELTNTGTLPAGVGRPVPDASADPEISSVPGTLAGA